MQSLKKNPKYFNFFQRDDNEELSWSDNKIKIKMTWSLAATLLLLSGDVELNPGPKKGAPKDTGPTPEQKIAELETTVKTYEEKISGKKTKMK